MDSLLLMGTTAAAALLAGAGLGLVLARRGSATKLAQLENEVSETRERAHLADTARVAAETQAEGHADRVAELEAKLLRERDAAVERLTGVQEEKLRLSETLAAQQSEQKAEREHQQARLTELKAAREEMNQAFKLTANEILKNSGQELNKQGAEGLQRLLTPLREQLGKLEGQVNKDAETRSGQTSKIEAVMQTLHGDAKRMSEEAQNLTKALSSSSKVQGDWGELVLARILEQAGLREGQEFFTQETKSTEDGRLLRPDVVVEMPGQQRLVIDSKVSLKDFERAVNADDDAERGAAVKAHINSVRTHIKSLGEKNYDALYEGVNFTVMFIPLEGAASLALQNDAELSSDAFSRGVMIATPTTLMMAMRTVQNLWTIDRQNQNARAIAERAGALYDKFNGFVEDLEKVGTQIDRAHQSWGEAKSKLVSGRGNVIRQAEMLKTLGAQTKKSLPDELLATAEGGADLPAIEHESARLEDDTA